MSVLLEAVVSGDLPAPLTPGTAWSSWTVDPPLVVVVLLAAVGYAVGVRRVGARADAGRRRWPVRRSLAFAAGLLVVLLATCSFLGTYARFLFWDWTIQVCVLLLVAPLLLGAGAPLALLRAARAGPTRSARPRRGVLVAAGSVLRKPGVGLLLLVVVTAVVFFTGVLPFALEHPAAADAVRLGLLAVGLVMALPVTDEAVSLSSLAYAAMLGLAFLEFLLDAVPGIVLRLHGTVLAAGYWASLHRSWGPTPLGDQQLAGDWLWFFGEAADIPFVAALLVAWIRADAREAAAHDAELDRLGL